MCRRETENKGSRPDTRAKSDMRAKPDMRAMARLTAAVIAATALMGTLAGCSDMYFDRRDTIALSGGDAVATDQAMQMNDPWPPASRNTAIAANGQRMQSAVERYRTNIVTQPVDPMQLQVANESPATAQSNSASNNPLPAPTVAPGTTTTTTTVVTAPPASSQ
jgi:hypothetical protein